MSLAAVKTFVPAEVLYAADLNALNTNILNNALALISPLTGALDVNSKTLLSVDEVALADAAANATTAGRLRRNATKLTWHDGTSAVRVVTTGTGLTDIDELIFTDATANATAAGRLRRNGTNLTWHNGTSASPVLQGAMGVLMMQVFS